MTVSAAPPRRRLLYYAHHHGSGHLRHAERLARLDRREVRARAKRFGLDGAIDAHLSLLESALESRRSGPAGA